MNKRTFNFFVFIYIAVSILFVNEFYSGIFFVLLHIINLIMGVLFLHLNEKDIPVSFVEWCKIQGHYFRMILIFIFVFVVNLVYIKQMFFNFTSLFISLHIFMFVFLRWFKGNKVKK